MTRANPRPIPPLAVLAGTLMLAACASDAPREAAPPSAPAQAAPRSANPTAPDARGVLIYQGYAAVVAQPGDTVPSMAARVGISPSQLSAYNGLPTSYMPQPGDELVLPPRPGGYVSAGPGAPATTPQPSPAPLSESPVSGATAAPAGQVETVAGAGWSAERISRAIGEGPSATPASVSPRAAPIDANEVAYHEVQAGQTVYSIARIYGILPQTLIAWNDLSGPSYSITPGQVLVIAGGGTKVDLNVPPEPNEPGAAGVAPPPPSSAAPLPADTVPAEPLASPNLSQYQTEPAPAEASVEALPASPAALPSTPPPPAEAAPGRLLRPVSGRILSPYNRQAGGARNDGIDFAAEPGEPVRAAAPGEVALVSRSLGEWGDIVLLRHDDGLMTVYGRMGEIAVEKGQAVQAGDVLGDVAAADSGQSTLHFEVRRGAFSENPETFF